MGGEGVDVAGDMVVGDSNPKKRRLRKKVCAQRDSFSARKVKVVSDGEK